MSSSKHKRHKKLIEMRDEDIDYSDIPELNEEFWETAKVVMQVTPEKRQISIKIDREVLDYFRQGGPGYQTRMNSVLRSFVRAQRRGGGR